MVVKLYGTPRSPFYLIVKAVLLEKQVPFEEVLVDTAKGEQKLPEYLSKHPFGQVPCIDDDGFILYESRAICYYIASKYPEKGPSLLPTGVEANALYQQAVFTEMCHFNEPALAAARELLVKEYRGLTPDKEVAAKHIADLSIKLDVYDQILSKQKYIAGDEITLVDFYHLIIGTALNDRTHVMESKPNVARWFKEISTRESWVTVQLEAKSALQSA